VPDAQTQDCRVCDEHFHACKRVSSIALLPTFFN
jgi:hypothetical protein